MEFQLRDLSLGRLHLTYWLVQPENCYAWSNRFKIQTNGKSTLNNTVLEKFLYKLVNKEFPCDIPYDWASKFYIMQWLVLVFHKNKINKDELLTQVPR